MEPIDIINQISAYFGLNVVSLVGIAVGITTVVNFLKSTSPFNTFVTGRNIPYVTGGLSLIVSGFTFWGNWMQFFDLKGADFFILSTSHCFVSNN